MLSVFTLVRMGTEPRVLPWLLADEFRQQVGCGISRYGGEAPGEPPPDIAMHRYIGGKWSGIFDFFARHPELVEKYEYFWFPDDDIETTPADALRFIDTVRQEKLALAQPALTSDSYYAHRITLANPRFSLRRTNFVELMMPIMRRDMLLRLLPLFKGRHAALGLDFFWHQLADDPQHEVAIVDAVPMGHRRPRMVHLKGNMTRMQIDIQEERERTFSEFSIRRQPPVILSATTVDGRRLQRGPALWREYFRGISQIRGDIARPPWTLMSSVKTLHAQLFSSPQHPCFHRPAYDRLVNESPAKIPA